MHHTAPLIALQAYGTVPSLDCAIALAGADAVPLTGLSRHAGPHHHLTLAPETHTVIWATRLADDQWVATELTAADALARVPARCAHEAEEEYRLLLRASLDGGADALPGHIDGLIRDHSHRIEHLRAISAELMASRRS